MDQVRDALLRATVGRNNGTCIRACLYQLYDHTLPGRDERWDHFDVLK